MTSSTRPPPMPTWTSSASLARMDFSSSSQTAAASPASFSRVARKYGIDYAIYRVKGEDKFLVFFKAPDQAAMNAAFAEYTARRVKAASRPSVMKKLEQMQSRIIHTIKDRVRHKEPER